MAIYKSLTVALLLLFSMSNSMAHDHWVSDSRLEDPFTGAWCCNLDDCKPEQVKEVSNGYMTEADFVVKERVLWKSQDGRWWRCRDKSTNATRCLIGPPPGS